jgi:site-specific DNA-methyltransferase (adenine-specific)
MQPSLTKITDIKLNPNNPRLIKDDKFKKLVQSVKDFPEMLNIRPIVVNKDMIILGGNMRFRACKEAGIKDIPVIVADLSEEKQREFLIKDNTSGGEWDWDMIANEWDTEELEAWGLDIPVFDIKDEGEADDDGYEAPEGGLETDIVLGDIFEIGQHKLICGDSTQTDTFGKLFDDQFADMVVTDPPYNVAYKGKTKDALTIENDNMGDKDFYQFLYDFYTALGSYSKAGGAWYVWHADSEGANFRQAMKDAGIMVKQCLIWVKNSMVMGRQDYQWKHEPCLYGWKEGAAHQWYSDRKQTTVLDFNRPSRNAEHPTMKPIELFAYQIKNSSKVGDIVADAFGGSGTTMVACHQLNRKGYIVEYDPRYCQVIIDRMIKLDPALVIKKNGEIWQAKTI